MNEKQSPQLMTKITSSFAWFLFFALLIGPLMGGITVPKIMNGAQDTQEFERRCKCVINLRTIGVALEDYHETYGCFPPAYTVDSSGKLLHSWRTLLLPFIGRSDIYEQIKLGEPWDSPDNLAVYQNMPIDIYQCPSCPELNNNDKTTYVMITGPACVSDGSHSCCLKDLKKKQCKVIHVIETSTPVRWYEPKDLKSDEINFKINDRTSPGIGSCHPGIVVATFCNGLVKMIDKNIAPEKLRTMFEAKKHPSWNSVLKEAQAL